MKWYYQESEQAIGPFNISEIKELIEKGTVKKRTLVKSETEDTWKYAVDTDIADMFGSNEKIEKSREKYKWYYLKAGNSIGPFQENEIAKMIKQGLITKNSIVREHNSDEWNIITDTYLLYYFDKADIEKTETKK